MDASDCLRCFGWWKNPNLPDARSSPHGIYGFIRAELTSHSVRQKLAPRSRKMGERLVGGERMQALAVALEERKAFELGKRVGNRKIGLDAESCLQPLVDPALELALG